MKQLVSHQKATAQQPTFIQPKLMVNAPNDVYEQEADAVADRVMRMPLVSSKAQGTQGLLASSVQRKCSHCEEEEKKKMPVMRKAEGGGGFETSPQFSSQLANTRGGGHVMPTETQSFMESRFGRDFSHVRLHTDGTAADMSAGIQAKAFTHGSDIYFNRGEYSPNTEGGRRLLAHELTHTVQQEGSEIKRAFPIIPVAIGAGIVAGAYALWAYNCLEPCNLPMYQATFGNDSNRSGGFRLWYFTRTGRPVPSNAWDAFGHCYAACCTTQRCGSTTSYIAGRSREFVREHLDPEPHDSYSQDVKNQELGRVFGGSSAVDCGSACQNAALGGMLDLTAPVSTLWTPILGEYPAP